MFLNVWQANNNSLPISQIVIRVVADADNRYAVRLELIARYDR